MSQRHEKKEKVIHTRISETLEQELKARASGLGVSVSNLVRNLLVSTFSAARPDAIDGHASSLPSQGVIGWQTFFLAVNTVCTDCNAILARGSDAAIGITARPGETRPVVCLRCVGERRSPSVPEA